MNYTTTVPFATKASIIYVWAATEVVEAASIGSGLVGGLTLHMTDKHRLKDIPQTMNDHIYLLAIVIEDL